MQKLQVLAWVFFCVSVFIIFQMLYPSAAFMLNMSLMPDISFSLCHKFNSIEQLFQADEFEFSSSELIC